MFDQYENIVKQYNIQVRNFYKGRGAIIIDTDIGFKLLKEVQLHEDKIQFMYEFQEVLRKEGFYVDNLLHNKEGQLFIYDDDKKYIMKNWVDGREIYFNDKEEVLVASRLLAKMHSVNLSTLKNSAFDKYDKTKSLVDILIRHNNELIRMRNNIKKMGKWSEFDLLFLKSFEEYYCEAKKAVNLICKIYDTILRRYSRNKVITHGQYNHHNLIFNENKNLHILNFEYASYNLPVMDLYSMLRKTLEKNDWDVKLGIEAIEEYSKIYHLTKEECKLIVYLFIYPEKFWKISNYYFNLNKAWKPKQTLVKLKRLVSQEEKKQIFIECLRKNI